MQVKCHLAIWVKTYCIQINVFFAKKDIFMWQIKIYMKNMTQKYLTYEISFKEIKKINNISNSLVVRAYLIIYNF